MKELISIFWGAAKAVTGDRNFDPTVFKFAPEFNEERSSVDFISRAQRETSIRIKGREFIIPKGHEYIIGCSQKTAPENIHELCEESGWNVIPTSFKSHTTTRAIMLAGKNLRPLQATT